MHSEQWNFLKELGMMVISHQYCLLGISLTLEKFTSILKISDTLDFSLMFSQT